MSRILLPCPLPFSLFFLWFIFLYSFKVFDPQKHISVQGRNSLNISLAATKRTFIVECSIVLVIFSDHCSMVCLWILWPIGLACYFLSVTVILASGRCCSLDQSFLMPGLWKCNRYTNLACSRGFDLLDVHFSRWCCFLTLLLTCVQFDTFLMYRI